MRDAFELKEADKNISRSCTQDMFLFTNLLCYAILNVKNIGCLAARHLSCGRYNPTLASKPLR